MSILFGFIGTILIVFIGVGTYFVGYGMAGFFYEMFSPKNGRLKLDRYTSYVCWVIFTAICLFFVILVFTGEEGLEILANYWR